MAKKKLFDLLNQFARMESEFLEREFFAPCLPGGMVSVRIQGVVCRFQIQDSFVGFGIFKPISQTQATLVRAATLMETQRYLELFVSRAMILVHKQGHNWLGWPAHQGDRRFGPPQLTPIRFLSEGQRFDRIITRFDGNQDWFESIDERGDSITAGFLRDQFESMAEPDSINRKGLTLEERMAYQIAFAIRNELLRDRTEDRLRNALDHAGADFQSYTELEDGYRVEFKLGDTRHVSLVNKKDLSLQLAGICLSGQDHRFDLQSLVSVLNEDRGVLRIGNDNQGMDESQYWEIHPPH
jgi:hypothetical protein